MKIDLALLVEAASFGIAAADRRFRNKLRKPNIKSNAPKGA